MTDVVAKGSNLPFTKTAETEVPQTAQTKLRNASRFQRIGTFLFSIAVVFALYIGWRQRGEQYLTAESGWGYALGIIGAVAMLLLSVYPLRKRLRSMRRWGAVSHWFRMHMILGIIGPVLILFHSNFKLGSTNSSIALLSMLLVVASGLVGRYLYSKIHYGLYGRSATLKGLRQDVEALRDVLADDLEESDWMSDHLMRFEEKVLAPHRGLLGNAWLLLTLGVRTRWVRRSTFRQLRSVFKQEAKRRGGNGRNQPINWKAACKQTCNHVGLYLTTIRKVAEFSFYERALALWHVLHLPLYIILFLATIVHIVAVHQF